MLKKLINKGIDSTPNIFKFGASKLKNKTINRALNSEIADLVVNEAQGRARKKYNIPTCSVKKMGGISNFQIEQAFKKIDDEDLLNNFVGVFPFNLHEQIHQSCRYDQRCQKISIHNCKYRCSW